MKLSVIIPVYNEQERINSLIDDIRSRCDCDIVVSDGNGNTINNIQDKSVISVSSSIGRGIQLADGARNATGDTLLFLHADTVLPDGFYEEIETALTDHDVGAFRLSIDGDSPMFRIIEWGVGVRNSITKTPYGDQAIFCRRDAYDQIFGFRDLPLMEDVRFMQDMKRQQKRIFLSDKCVVTSSRRWKSEGILYTMLRNWTIITLYYLGVSPYRLKKFYK